MFRPIFLLAMLGLAAPLFGADACTPFLNLTSDGEFKSIFDPKENALEESFSQAKDECINIMKDAYPTAWNVLMTDLAWHGVPYLPTDRRLDEMNERRPYLSRHMLTAVLRVANAKAPVPSPPRGACAPFRLSPPTSKNRSRVPVPVGDPEVVACFEEMRSIYPNSWEALSKIRQASKNLPPNTVRRVDLHAVLESAISILSMLREPEIFDERTHSEDYAQTSEELFWAERDTSPMTLERAERLNALYKRYLYENREHADWPNPRLGRAPKEWGDQSYVERLDALEKHQPLLMTLRKAAAAGGVPFTPPQPPTAGQPSQPVSPTTPAAPEANPQAPTEAASNVVKGITYVGFAALGVVVYLLLLPRLRALKFKGRHPDTIIMYYPNPGTGLPPGPTRLLGDAGPSTNRASQP